MADLKAYPWIVVLDPPPGGPYTVHDWFADNVQAGAVRVFTGYPFPYSDYPETWAVETTTYMLTKGTDVSEDVGGHQQHVVVRSVTDPTQDPAPYAVWFSEIEPGQ